MLDAARASVGIKEWGPEHAVAVVPDGFTVKDLSSLLPPPPRPKESIVLLSPRALAEYVRAFGQAPLTAIFADEPRGHYQAILDYHQPGQPGRGTCDHRAVYDCPASEEWKIWTAAHGKQLPQVDFARFLENNLPDIVAPAAADMLRVALTLQVKKDVNFESDLRLDNGQAQLRYEETVRGTTRAGDLVIPDQFTISIPVFEGTPRVTIVARLRYRLAEQKLVMWYELVHQLKACGAPLPEGRKSWDAMKGGELQAQLLANAERVGVPAILKDLYEQKIVRALRQIDATTCTCIGCGCTYEDACEGGCSWVAVDHDDGIGVCSSCQDEHLARFEAGERELSPEAEARMAERDEHWDDDADDSVDAPVPDDDEDEAA